MGKIAGRLEESPIPYQVDLSLWKQIDNQNLLEHIERVGVVFYERADRDCARKKGWEVKKLGLVYAINYGYTESASKEPIGPRFRRITDIQDYHVELKNVPYCKIQSSDIPKSVAYTHLDVYKRQESSSTSMNCASARRPKSMS